MRCRFAFVWMYLCVYVYMLDAVHDNWDLHFAIIGPESGRYITA